MVEVSAIAVPLLTLAVALAVGVGFSFAPAKNRSRKPLPVVAFGAVVGIVGLLVVFAFNSTLTSSVYTIGLFHSFAAIFSGINVPVIMYNPGLVASIVLLAAVEIGLASGFSTAFAVQGMKVKTQLTQPTAAETEQRETAQTSPEAKLSGLVSNQAKDDDDDDTTSADESLLRDEQSLMELFLYGKVTQITPTINPTKPEGYSYNGLPHLDWDTKHTTQVLDALVRKGYLNSELIDKMVLCQTCGSGNVRIIKSCPECGSLRLHKEGLIEHFSCGAVERQSAFESKNGDLICPKCKAKLQLIGSDYRTLPSAYKCLSCNTLHSEPKLLVKCVDCTSTAELDDEPEVMLYKYTPNPHMPTKELQRIKPIDNVTQYFKNLGYTIVAPAFVSGKSGTQHLFDMLVLGKIDWMESEHSDKPEVKDGGNTAVEVIISGKPINVGEITRIYGKISDIDTGFILFAIPGLTPNARNYAKAYHMKISEGKSIEEALANSKIPKAAEGEKSMGVLPPSVNPVSVHPSYRKE
jgi:hypothetical protein